MWYYAAGDEQIGPIEDTAFRELVSTGAIGANTLVWRDGMSDWAPYGTLQQRMAAVETGGATVPCVECGAHFSPDEMVIFDGRAVCAGCKDLFFQRLREGHAHAGDLIYASVVVRFFALLIDAIILSVGMGILVVGMMVLVGLFGISGGASSDAEAAFALSLGLGFFGLFLGGIVFYFTWFVGRYGATPGKMVLGIKIVRPDGGPVSYLRAFARMWALELSRMIFYIGFVIAFFDDQKRALHDHICDTRVVQKR